jgi:hypothetical protein
MKRFAAGLLAGAALASGIAVAATHDAVAVERGDLVLPTGGKIACGYDTVAGTSIPGFLCFRNPKGPPGSMTVFFSRAEVRVLRGTAILLRRKQP